MALTMEVKDCDNERQRRGPRRAVAGHQALPVADGPHRPDGDLRDAAGGLGDEPARLAHRGPGAAVDRPDPAVRAAAVARLALRGRWAERARRGDGSAGE